MYRLIDHKQNILRPKGDQSFHTVCANCGHSVFEFKSILMVANATIAASHEVALAWLQSALLEMNSH